MKAKPTRFAIPMAVRGRAPFPVDMLRYDFCVPASETDSNTIKGLLQRDLEGNSSST